MYSSVIVIQCLFLFQATMADSTMDLLKLSVSNQVLVLNSKIAELKALVEHQNTQFAKENLKFSEENAKLAKVETKIGKLEFEITKLTHSHVTATMTKPLPTPTTLSTIDTASGVVFTRWGRRDCPAGISTSVYNGTTGGSSYDHTGEAVNHLCMPNDPTWDVHKLYKYTKKDYAFGGYVYGSKYHLLPDASLASYVTPCAVCRSTSFSTKVMIPGRETCYPGWTEAYNGELISGLPSNKAATEYACLDRQPQKGVYNNDNGFFFFPVFASCEGLLCPPYKDGALLTCVVCLK